MKVSGLTIDERLTWFHCFPGKLLNALAGMTPDQKLTYVIILLRIYEVRGPCMDSIDVLARRIGINKRRASEAIKALFDAGKLEPEGGGIHNPFARKTMAAGQSLHSERKRAGAIGGRRAAENRETNQSSDNDFAPVQRQQLKEKEESLFPTGNRPGEPESGEETGRSLEPIADPEDVRTQLFRRGLATLCRISGLNEGRARPIIGKWLRDARDDAVRVLRCIEDAERERIADPVPWITRAIPARGAPTESRNVSERGGAAALLVMEEERKAHVDHESTVPAGTAGGGGQQASLALRRPRDPADRRRQADHPALPGRS